MNGLYCILIVNVLLSRLSAYVCTHPVRCICHAYSHAQLHVHQGSTVGKKSFWVKRKYKKDFRFFSLGPSAKTEIWPRQRPDFRVKTEVKKRAPFFSAIFLKRSDGNMHVLLQVKGGTLHWHSLYLHTRLDCWIGSI